MSSAAAKRALRIAAGLTNELSALAAPKSPLRVAHDGVARDDRDVLAAYDLLIDDEELRTTTRQLFRNGHMAQSVEEGFKYVNNLVKHRTGLPADGADLMRKALSLKDPALKLSALKTQSQRDHQLGYMEIMAGAMTGVRNPRAHEHRYLEDPLVALELLCLANHLSRSIRGATRTRRRRIGSR